MKLIFNISKLQLLVLSFFLFVACESSTKKQIEETNTKMMKLHDEVMPKTMKLGEMRDKVLKSVLEADSTKKNEAAKVANLMQLAEDGMYKWMDDYSQAMNNKDEQTKLVEYQKLLADIEKTKKETTFSIQAAEAFLKK